MPRADFFTFLRESLWLVAAEAPEAYRALAREVEGLRARLVADREPRTIRFDRGQFAIFTAPAEADVEVGFERAVIIDLIEGRLTLEDALYQERLRIRGRVEDVERFHAGLLIFLEGSLRSPGVPPLLARYRGETGSDSR